MATAPTQVRRPWRTVARSVFQAAVAFAAMWAVIVETIGLDPSWQWVSASLAVTGAVTRVMALPAVDDFLARFVPWLATQPGGTYGEVEPAKVYRILGKA